MSKRELPPVTESVTREELMNILFREVYSVKDHLTETDVRELLSSIGIDYDKALSKLTA